MEKTEFKIVPKKNILLDFQMNQNKVEVLPYIDLATAITLTNIYLDIVYGDWNIKEKIVRAEHALILAIIDFCTNIPIEEDKVDINAIISSGLWDSIKDSIINYKDFRNTLNDTIDFITKTQSVGGTLENMANKVIEFLNRMSDMDLSDESLNRVSEKVSEFNESIQSVQKTLGVPAKRGRKPALKE